MDREYRLREPTPCSDLPRLPAALVAPGLEGSLDPFTGSFHQTGDGSSRTPAPGPQPGVTGDTMRSLTTDAAQMMNGGTPAGRLRQRPTASRSPPRSSHVVIFLPTRVGRKTVTKPGPLRQARPSPVMRRRTACSPAGTPRASASARKGRSGRRAARRAETRPRCTPATPRPQPA